MNTPIPENLIQVCRELADVARKHKLTRMAVTFDPNVFDDWNSTVEATWQSGRHDDQSGTVRIRTQHYLHTQIDL